MFIILLHLSSIYYVVLLFVYLSLMWVVCMAALLYLFLPPCIYVSSSIDWTMVFLWKQDGLHFLEKVVVVPCLRWLYFMVRTSVFSGKWGPLNLVFNIFRQLWRNFVCGRWQVPSIKHMLWEWKKYVSMSLFFQYHC